MNGMTMSDKSRVILKFPSPHKESTITVRKDACVVLVDHQDGVPTIWVEVDINAEPVQWDVFSVATGEEDRIGLNDAHLGSFTVNGHRRLVWHLYLRNGLDLV